MMKQRAVYQDERELKMKQRVSELIPHCVEHELDVRFFN